MAHRQSAAPESIEIRMKMSQHTWRVPHFMGRVSARLVALN